MDAQEEVTCPRVKFDLSKLQLVMYVPDPNMPIAKMKPLTLKLPS